MGSGWTTTLSSSLVHCGRWRRPMGQPVAALRAVRVVGRDVAVCGRLRWRVVAIVHQEKPLLYIEPNEPKFWAKLP